MGALCVVAERAACTRRRSSVNRSSRWRVHVHMRAYVRKSARACMFVRVFVFVYACACVLVCARVYGAEMRACLTLAKGRVIRWHDRHAFASKSAPLSGRSELGVSFGWCGPRMICSNTPSEQNPNTDSACAHAPQHTQHHRNIARQAVASGHYGLCAQAWARSQGRRGAVSMCLQQHGLSGPVACARGAAGAG